MGRRPKITTEADETHVPPARTAQGREDQLINLAVDLAEKQLREGTASSQVVVHYLKLATEKEKLEREKIRQENSLLSAKTVALESEQRVEELYLGAIKAMRKYSGEDDD